MTHDFCCINYVIKQNGKRNPIRVCAMQSKLIFKGDMPVCQKCAECPKKDECLEDVEKFRVGGGFFCMLDFAGVPWYNEYTKQIQPNFTLRASEI